MGVRRVAELHASSRRRCSHKKRGGGCTITSDRSLSVKDGVQKVWVEGRGGEKGPVVKCPKGRKKEKRLRHFFPSELGKVRERRKEGRINLCQKFVEKAIRGPFCFYCAVKV